LYVNYLLNGAIETTKQKSTITTGTATGQSTVGNSQSMQQVLVGGTGLHSLLIGFLVLRFSLYFIVWPRVAD